MLVSSELSQSSHRRIVAVVAVVALRLLFSHFLLQLIILKIVIFPIAFDNFGPINQIGIGLRTLFLLWTIEFHPVLTTHAMLELPQKPG